MVTLSVGKVRGLSQIASTGGVFEILACDQRGAMARLMEQAARSGAGAFAGEKPGHADIVKAKLEIVGALSPLASGVLLDPEFGAAQCVMHRALAGSAGLAVAVEATGYTEEAGDRLTELLAGWGPEAVKAMGASAVKLLLYFNPKREKAAERQCRIVEQVAAACEALDIPFMLEGVVYPTVYGDDAAFAAEKEDLVVESARILSRYNVDLYKVEFPARPGADERDWPRACERLTDACRVPWALLSAGVDFDTYARQLVAACRAGASGFVAGRAIWKEAVTLPPGPERERFLRGEMQDRFRRLAAIAEAHARPWYSVPSHAYDPGDVQEGWYAAYGARFAGAEGR